MYASFIYISRGVFQTWEQERVSYEKASEQMGASKKDICSSHLGCFGNFYDMRGIFPDIFCYIFAGHAKGVFAERNFMGELLI